MTRFNVFETALFGDDKVDLINSAENLERPEDEEALEWERRCKETLLPELLEDPLKNRLRIAYILTFIDSRQLDEETRMRLGLSPIPDFSETKDLAKLPSLTDWSTYPWKWVCGGSGYYQEEAFDRVSGELTHNETQVSFEFARCMAGKAKRVTMGLCFETTEFPNGSVFLKGIWYRLLGPRSAIGRIKEMNADSEHKPYFNWSNYRESGNDPYQSYNLVIWENCGGVWAPTVHDDTGRIDYGGWYD